VYIYIHDNGLTALLVESHVTVTVNSKWWCVQSELLACDLTVQLTLLVWGSCKGSGLCCVLWGLSLPLRWVSDEEYCETVL